MTLLETPVHEIEAAVTQVSEWPDTYRLCQDDTSTLRTATRGFWTAITRYASHGHDIYTSRFHFSVWANDIVFPEESRETFIGRDQGVVAKRVKLGKQLAEYALAKHDYTAQPDDFSDLGMVRRYGVHYKPHNICGDGSLQYEINDRLLAIDAKVMLEIGSLIHEGHVATRDLTPPLHSSVVLKL